ncbi:hypothetical protein [Microbispora hainanensis]|nr:hypothetical protein [Microbispora hainanensis]
MALVVGVLVDESPLRELIDRSVRVHKCVDRAGRRQDGGRS